MDKNLPANAGDMGSIPGLGRLHMPWSIQVLQLQLLSLRAATIEPLSPRACTLQQEKPLHHSPHSRQLEKVKQSTEDLCRQKQINTHVRVCETDNSLAVQWLELCTFTVQGPSSILGSFAVQP